MKHYILAAAISLLPGLSFSQPVKTPVISNISIESLRKDYDKMNGITWYQHKTSPTFRNRNGVYVYFGKKDNGQLLPLRFVIQYFAEDWLFVNRAWAKVDGTNINLPQKSGTFGWERDNSGGNIWEWSDKDIRDSEMPSIKKFAEGKSVTIRFEGRQYYNDKDITPAQLKAMRDVIAIYESQSGKK